MKTKVRKNLLNHAATKHYILTKLQEERPHLGFNRVSKEALLLLEVRIRLMLDRAIWAHSSTGKTFRDIP